MKKFFIGVLFSSVIATGCATSNARTHLIAQVSFDHDCDKQQIEILTEDTEIWAYKVKACGKTYKYRDYGNEQEFQFFDVTYGKPNLPKISD